LKVAKAHKSVAVATRYDLTMEQAAGLAEFEDDKAAIVRLTEVAKKRPEQFEHELSRSRQERERLAKVAEMRAHFQSQGVKILGDRERFGYDVASKAGCYLSSLASPTGTGRMTEAEHKDCPGHAVELEMWGERYSPGCTNPKKHGHKLFRQTYAGDSRTAKPKMADLPPAEQEKARKQRRELVSNNRAWRAALPVRRKFVRELLLRKTLPKGTPRFLARVIAGHGHETGRSESDLAELLNLKTKAGYGYPAHTKLQEQARRLPDRVVLMPLLAHACAQCEYPLRLSEHTWQGSHEETAVYFRFLQSNGYGLSDVELGTCLRYEGKTAEAAQAFARNIPVDRNTPRRARAVAKKATKKGTPVTKTPARKRAVKKAKP
jgi:ParB family chromosome partitioning protein